MTWTPPPHWGEDLRDALSSAAADAGMTMGHAGRLSGQPHTPAHWMADDGPLPTVRSLVRFCTAVGVRPSELLARIGL